MVMVENYFLPMVACGDAWEGPGLSVPVRVPVRVRAIQVRPVRGQIGTHHSRSSRTTWLTFSIRILFVKKGRQPREEDVEAVSWNYVTNNESPNGGVGEQQTPRDRRLGRFSVGELDFTTGTKEQGERGRNAIVSLTTWEDKAKDIAMPRYKLRHDFLGFVIATEKT